MANRTTKRPAHRKSAFGKAQPSPSLDDLLGVYSVGEVDADHIAANNGNIQGLLGWFWVCNDEGVYAYFSKESDAFRFRLAEINRRLNG